MKTIWADFNARTETDRVRLDTRGSQESVSQNPISVGEWLWLTDDEVTVGAQIEAGSSGLLARPAWDTAEEVAADTSETAVEKAVLELRARMASPVRDYKAVLRLIPLARRGVPSPGYVEFLKSRALAALGYAHLALSAANDAVARAPDAAPFKHHQLLLLDQLNHSEAVKEVRWLLTQNPKSLVLLACVQILAADARHDGAVPAALQEIIAAAERFENAADRSSVPSSAIVSAGVARGFALARLGRRAEAQNALTLAVNADPTNPASRLARGVVTYPSADAVADLQVVVNASWPNFTPHYLLAHHAVSQQRWLDARRHSEAALRLFPSAHARANLLEWLAIVAYEASNDVTASRKLLLEALSIEELPHLRANLRELERLASSSGSGHTPWAVPADQTADFVAAESDAAAQLAAA